MGKKSHRNRARQINAPKNKKPTGRPPKEPEEEKARIDEAKTAEQKLIHATYEEEKKQQRVDEQEVTGAYYSADFVPTPAIFLERSFESLLKQFGDPAFLPRNEFDKVLLCSFPRSGNTLFRSYMEHVTRIITGSDCNRSRKLIRELIDLGMQGEGIVDERVWIVKTHFPERLGGAQIAVHKCLLVVRNPLDCIVSMYNMIATGSHSTGIGASNYIGPESKRATLNAAGKFQALWEEYVQQEVEVWREYHAYWLHKDHKVPVFVVRYEDLLLRPEETLCQVFCFLLNERSVKGTLIEALVQRVVHEEGRPQVYKPRCGKANANQDKYSEDMRTFVFFALQDLLKSFGYINNKNAEYASTNFFRNEDGSDNLDYVPEFVLRNAEAMDVVTSGAFI